MRYSSIFYQFVSRYYNLIIIPQTKIFKKPWQKILFFVFKMFLKIFKTGGNLLLEKKRLLF